MSQTTMEAVAMTAAGAMAVALAISHFQALALEARGTTIPKVDMAILREMSFHRLFMVLSAVQILVMEAALRMSLLPDNCLLIQVRCPLVSTPPPGVRTFTPGPTICLLALLQR